MTKYHADSSNAHLALILSVCEALRGSSQDTAARSWRRQNMYAALMFTLCLFPEATVKIYTSL